VHVNERSTETVAPVFALRDVSVAYGETVVLQNVSLDVRPGEHIAIFGQSGAGKTTLLRKLYEMLPEHTALIHQDFSLVPQLSVFHNVYAGRLDQKGWFHNLRNLVRADSVDAEDVERIVDKIGLRGRLWDGVSELSGGQQQRVAVARAVYRGVDVILADEPVAAVDPQQSIAVLDMLKEAAETVIVALHDVTLGLDAFSRVIGMRSGRVDFDLPVDEVTADHLDRLYLTC
jgi:phosphonate transport system ATP-binding protein